MKRHHTSSRELPKINISETNWQPLLRLVSLVHDMSGRISTWSVPFGLWWNKAFCWGEAECANIRRPPWSGRWRRSLEGGRQQRSWGFPTATCSASGSGMTSTAMTGCSTDGGASRAQHLQTKLHRRLTAPPFPLTRCHTPPLRYRPKESGG